jgi:hypothetical protein
MQPTLKFGAPPSLTQYSQASASHAGARDFPARAKAGRPSEIIMAIDSIDQENFTAW